jgi:hypothetical protein
LHIDGSQIRNAIYASGELPWPVGAEEWEASAAAYAEQLAAETDLTLALIGAAGPAELDGTWIAASS